MKKITLIAFTLAVASMLSACEVIFPKDHHNQKRYDQRSHRDQDSSDHRQHRDKKHHDDDRDDRYDDDDDDDRHHGGNFCPPGQAKKGRC